MYWIAIDQLKPLRLAIRFEGNAPNEAVLVAAQFGGMSRADGVFAEGGVEVMVRPVPTEWERTWHLIIVANGDDGDYRARLTVRDEETLLLREPIVVTISDGKAMWIETIGITVREAGAVPSSQSPAKRQSRKVRGDRMPAKSGKAAKSRKDLDAVHRSKRGLKNAAPRKAAKQPPLADPTASPTHAPAMLPESGIDEGGFDPRNIKFGDPGPMPEDLKEQPPKSTIQQVWFGTNHARDESKSGLKFTERYAETVTYGWCDVQIPEWHKTGSLGSNWYKRLRSGHDDRLRIVDVETLEVVAFWEDVARAVAAAPDGERHAVVYIHGYKNSFENAVLRAAQLGADLKITGAMGLFAWASRDAFGKYMGDESAIESSEHHIEQFLIDFANRSGAEAVHVIAHSMGNRAVLRIVDRMVLRAEAGTGVRFGQVILAAPDVNEHLFAHIASAYKKVSERTTIYVSSRDLALKLSALLHGASRAGGSNNRILAVDGLDTIVASYVETGILGHDYFATSREFITDMHDLIQRGTPPKKRIGLEAIVERPYRYWVMRPSV